MTMEMFTEKVIGGATYRVGRLGATRGAFILHIVLTAGGRQARKELANAPTHSESKPEPTPEERERIARELIIALWAQASLEISEETAEKIQKACLQVCGRLNPSVIDAPPDPVLMTDGRWALRELENDIATVNALVNEVLRFNLAPFFIGDALSQ